MKTLVAVLTSISDPGFNHQDTSRFRIRSHISRIFFENYTLQPRRPHTHAHSPLWTHIRKLYLYEHLRRTEPADLEIHEVTIGTSLSTGTSPTTESIAPLNPRINLGKHEHLCQVEDLNPALREKWFVATGQFFCRGGWWWSRPYSDVLGCPDTSHPYKWNSRGGWWYESSLQMGSDL